MTEVQVLFLILAGVYLLQCIGWAPLESEVLRISWRFRAKILPHGLPLRFGHYKLFLLNPFSPLAGAIICESFPSVRTSDEEFSADSNPPKLSGVTSSRMIRLNCQEKQQIQSAGKEVRSAGRVLFFAHSEACANFLAGVLDRVRKKSPQERDRAFEREFEKMFDTKKVALRLEEYKSHAAFLRTTCVLLFVFCALYSGQKEGRWQQVMVLALSPFSAIRANDVLLRDLFCAFHPLAVAWVLLSKEDVRVQAERTLRQSLFRTDKDAASSDAAMRRALESFLAKNGMPQEELLRPPLRESGNCRTYCPLCLAQFVLAEGECPDCGEVQLKTFPLGSESVPGDRP